MRIGRTLRDMQRRTSEESERTSIALDEDTLFWLLADSRRRYVVERLADRERDVPTLPELAVEIAADETHMAPEQVPDRRVDPVERDVREVHLPKLVEAGVVEWDGGAGAVWPGHSIDAIARLLGEVDRRVRPGAAVGWVGDRRAGPVEPSDYQPSRS